MNFDAAMRQNRRGRIRVCQEAAALTDAVALLQGHMLITDRHDDDVELGAQEWAGYSPDFEPLALGAAVPIYRAIFDQAEDGSLTLTFRPSQ